MAAFDGLVLHGVEDLQSRNDLAAGEHADLELVVGRGGDPLGDLLGGAEEDVEVLREARGAAPLDLRRVAHEHGRRRDVPLAAAIAAGALQKCPSPHVRNPSLVRSIAALSCLHRYDTPSFATDRASIGVAGELQATSEVPDRSGGRVAMTQPNGFVSSRLR